MGNTFSEIMFVAGPCSIENEYIAMTVAEEVKSISDDLGVKIVFKGSYDKANRTKNASPRGPGMLAGLRLLENVKYEFGLETLTDVHETGQVEVASYCVDILQIPAFLSRQTDLIRACARTGKHVNIKKGQFMSPSDATEAAYKVLSVGKSTCSITERGTTFGYNDVVFDPRNILKIKCHDIPVWYDATHTVKDRTLVTPLAKAAVVLGASAIYIETHPNPPGAESDSESQVYLSDLRTTIQDILDVYSRTRGH